jgi:hypothetical protein
MESTDTGVHDRHLFLSCCDNQLHGLVGTPTGNFCTIVIQSSSLEAL